MIIWVSEVPKDQDMIEKFQRACENLKTIVNKQKRKIKDLDDQIAEFRKRHPSSVGLKMEIHTTLQYMEMHNMTTVSFMKCRRREAKGHGPATTFQDQKEAHGDCEDTSRYA